MPSTLFVCYVTWMLFVVLRRLLLLLADSISSVGRIRSFLLNSAPFVSSIAFRDLSEKLLSTGDLFGLGFKKSCSFLLLLPEIISF